MKNHSLQISDTLPGTLADTLPGMRKVTWNIVVLLQTLLM